MLDEATQEAKRAVSERNDTGSEASALAARLDEMRAENNALLDANAQLSDDLWQKSKEIIDLRTNLRSITIDHDKLFALAAADRDSFENPIVNIIPVIKAVREKWGLGLKDSKEIVDTWRATERAEAESEWTRNPFLRSDD